MLGYLTNSFALPTCVRFGVAILWAGWPGLGESAGLLAVLVLRRRPPVVLGLARGLHPPKTRKDVGFVAWFRPIGV